jgi:hypothetical protein
MHRRGRRPCHAAAWPPVGADPAGTARAGERHHAVAAPPTARCPAGAARRWAAVPGRARCPGGVVRYGAARRWVAVRGRARCPGGVVRYGAARRWVAVRGTARCLGGVRYGAARPGVAAPGTARCPRAAARREAAVWKKRRCRYGTARCAPAAGPARCRRAGLLARRRRPEEARRRAAMARREERPPGLRRCRSGCRPAADKSRDRRGRRALAGAHAVAGLAPAPRAPAHPTGRAPARRRAHPENPWRERIPLSA